MELVWKRTLETGVNFIDNDHKTLISICNELLAALASNAPARSIMSIVSALSFVWHKHVRSEEALMAKLDYGLSGVHCAHHNKLLDMLTSLEYSEHDRNMRSDLLLSILIEFIAIHLDDYDEPLAKFLKTRQLCDISLREADDLENILFVWEPLNGDKSLQHLTIYKRYDNSSKNESWRGDDLCNGPYSAAI